MQVELDSQLCLESKTEPSVAKAHNYIGSGGNIYWGQGCKNTLNFLTPDIAISNLSNKFL